MVEATSNIVANAEPIEMLLNMGPQHPSTHGVFRMVLWVDGEKVVDIVPHIGYLHRGSEKLCEGEQYHQVITLFDRLDYIANFNNEHVYCRAVEKLMGLEVPERAEYVRIILCELNRIASHLLFIATMGLDAGAMTPSMFCLPGPGADSGAFRARVRRPHDAQLLPGRRPQGRRAGRLHEQPAARADAPDPGRPGRVGQAAQLQRDFPGAAEGHFPGHGGRRH